MEYGYTLVTIPDAQVPGYDLVVVFRDRDKGHRYAAANGGAWRDAFDGESDDEFGAEG